MCEVRHGTQVWRVGELEALIGDASVAGEADLEAVGVDGELRDAELSAAQRARRIPAVIMERLPAALDDEPVVGRLSAHAVDRHTEALHAHAHTPLRRERPPVAFTYSRTPTQRTHCCSALSPKSYDFVSGRCLLLLNIRVRSAIFVTRR